MDLAALADEVDRRIAAVERPSVEPLRRIRRDVSARAAEPADVLLVRRWSGGTGGWPTRSCTTTRGLAALTVGDVERLGAGWPTGHRGRLRPLPVRTGVAAGAPAGRRRTALGGLADRWWRRAALVSTVPLNLAAAGGTGDAPGPSTSAGGWWTTGTTWWSRRCRGRCGSWSAGPGGRAGLPGGPRRPARPGSGGRSPPSSTPGARADRPDRSKDPVQIVATVAQHTARYVETSAS